MRIETRRRLDVLWIAGLAGTLCGLMLVGVIVLIGSFMDNPASPDEDGYPQIFPSTTVRTITVEQKKP